MKAVILAGGKGTRLADETFALPKPMIEIGGKPILWHIMKIYSYHGIKDFVICLGHKGWVIKEFFLHYRAKISDFTVTLGDEQSVQFHNPSGEEDWRVTLVETGEQAQTGTRIWNARRYLEGEEMFAVTYGDGVGDIDIQALIETHRQSGLIGTVTAVRPAGRFGEIEVQDHLITEFNEKPNVGSGYINGGFMLFDAKRIWPFFKNGEDMALEIGVLPEVVRQKQLGIFKHTGFWQCIDTYREYTMLNRMWDEGKAAWKIWA